jgi:hypothetical protein
MVEELPGAGRVTLAADKGYDTQEFVATLRGFEVTPHVAQNTSGRASSILDPSPDAPSPSDPSGALGSPMSTVSKGL